MNSLKRKGKRPPHYSRTHSYSHNSQVTFLLIFISSRQQIIILCLELYYLSIHVDPLPFVVEDRPHMLYHHQISSFRFIFYLASVSLSFEVKKCFLFYLTYLSFSNSKVSHPLCALCFFWLIDSIVALLCRSSCALYKNPETLYTLFSFTPFCFPYCLESCNYLVVNWVPLQTS